MDFNVKKLASGAGLFFTRAVQVTTETTNGERDVTDASCRCDSQLLLTLPTDVTDWRYRAVSDSIYPS